MRDCCGDDSAEQIAAASPHELSAAAPLLELNRLQRATALSATIAVALLPKCPLCWSVYAGVSSWLGLSFVVEPRYLLPLTLLSLLASVFWIALAERRARERRWRWRRTAVACAAASGVVAGKFGIDSSWLMYASLLALAVAASSRFWGARALRARAPAQNCPITPALGNTMGPTLSSRQIG